MYCPNICLETSEEQTRDKSLVVTNVIQLNYISKCYVYIGHSKYRAKWVVRAHGLSQLIAWVISVHFQCGNICQMDF